LILPQDGQVELV